jgi:hypothetical protein
MYLQAAPSLHSPNLLKNMQYDQAVELLRVWVWVERVLPAFAGGARAGRLRVFGTDDPVRM